MRAIFLCLVLFALSARADSWSFPAELQTTQYEFGTTRVVRIVDARKGQTYPDFRIDVYTDGDLVGRYGGQYFEDIAASEDNRVFVGISNRGLPYTAIIIFDSRGNLRALVNHNVDPTKFDYCDESITLQRAWYDSESPGLRFVESDSGTEIEVRGCRGGVLSLSEMLR